MSSPTKHHTVAITDLQYSFCYKQKKKPNNKMQSMKYNAIKNQQYVLFQS